MSQVLVTESYLDDIADAIRDKTGSEDTYTPAQMAGGIEDIHTADEVVLVSKSISANGTYNPASDSADGYSGVTVDVPNTYTVSDEGKVVSSGNLVSQSSKSITQNGTHDTTMNNSVSVDVPNSYSASDNGKVVVNQALADQTSKNINSNGTHDTTANNSVVVDVPNSYVAADEGKVVSSGELVLQTSMNISSNGTYDTTENNEVVVAVPTSGGGGDVIPDNYQQVEYVELNGSCYATVPLSLNVSDVIDVSVTKKSNTSSEEAFIGYQDYIEFYSSSGSSKVWPTSGSNDYLLSKVTTLSKGSANNNSTFNTSAVFTRVGQLNIFNIGVYNPSNYPFVGYLNGMSVLRPSEGVYSIYRKYVPVRRKSDDKVGIFEMKTSQFYPSVGNTEFIAGPDIT